MRINEYLLHNDPNYRNLVEEQQRESWEPNILPYTAFSDLQLRRYPSGQWFIKYFAQGYPQELGGHITWKNKGNTSQVRYLFEELQAEFLLSRTNQQAIRDCVIEDQQTNVLWQVIWIDDVQVDDRDRKRLIPDAALIIYNNQVVWKAYSQFRGTYYQYKVPKAVEAIL
jgi:hypothetical protein